MKTAAPAYPLLAPLLLVMGVFFVAPLLLVAGYSFMTANPHGGAMMPVTTEAYRQIFAERDFDGAWQWSAAYLDVFWRSVKYAGIATLVCAMIGIPAACYMATRPRHARARWVMLVTVPFWSSLLIRTYAWMLMLRSEGIINSLLMKVGLIDAPLPLLYNGFAVGLGLTYSYLPFMILPVYASLERMDWRLAEAAADLYASPWQNLRHVILPQARAGIVAGCVLVFIPAIGSFLAADLLGGGREMMIGNLIQIQFSFARDWPFGAAASVVLMITVMAGVWVMSRKRGIRTRA